MPATNNSFSIAPNSFARTVVHHEGKEFVVEFKFDVAVVREKAGSVPPQFDLDYRVSAIVQPASAGSEPTQLPAAFAPQRSLLVAGHDGRGYETALDASVTNVQLHAPNDLLTGMPTATASFTWSGSSARPSDEVPDSVFACVYCGHEHPRSFRSDEHIVPRAFLSPSYVLKGTCHTLNHYFSHAFEKRCLQLPVIQELLLLFDPPKMPVFRGRVPTTDGRDVARWLHDGKNEIGELPQYTETDKCTVSITTAGGDVVRVTIRLPFPIVGSVQGLGRLLEEPDRRVERDRQRVTEYLRELETDPTRNADLARALEEHGARFVAPREVRMQRSERADPEVPQVASTTIPLQGDDELLTKLLYKIAWTHAAKQLGPEVVRSSRFGRGMIEFLRSEHIIDRAAAATVPALFTKPVTIHGSEYVFWKSDLETSTQAIARIGEASRRETLGRLLDYRATRAAFVRPYIHMAPIPEFDDALRASMPRRRFHELSLRTVMPNDTQFTVCDVVLFGGIIRAQVPLSEEPLAANYPAPTRINF